jgi:hypothetical protein
MRLKLKLQARSYKLAAMWYKPRVLLQCTFHTTYTLEEVTLQAAQESWLVADRSHRFCCHITSLTPALAARMRWLLHGTPLCGCLAQGLLSGFLKEGLHAVKVTSTLVCLELCSVHQDLEGWVATNLQATQEVTICAICSVLQLYAALAKTHLELGAGVLLDGAVYVSNVDLGVALERITKLTPSRC